MPETIRVERDTVGQWPWKASEANPGAWCEISEEHYMYCLEVLPPIYFDGGFAMSEFSRDDVTLCLVQVRAHYYAKECRIAQAADEARILRHLVTA